MDMSMPFAGAVDLASLAPKRAAPKAGVAGAPASMTEANAGNYVQESQRRPVFVLMCSSLAPQCEDLSARVISIAAEYGTSVELVTVDVDVEVGLAEAFQIKAVPAMLAILAGRPVPLFQGSPDDEQVRGIFAQVIEVAKESGMAVSGSEAPAAAGGDGEAPEAPEAPLPPLHQEAFDAIERDDFDGALAAYDQALRENPRDADARAGRAQVGLIARSRNVDPGVVRAAAADDSSNVDAQLAVADLDVLGGQVEDALARLLELVSATAGDERERVRIRIVDLFEVVGPTDPRVVAARKALASALN